MLLEPIGNTLTIKQLTSTADQLGKARTLCEAFGTIGQQSSFYHRKWIADWLVALGINFINQHLSLYSMSETLHAGLEEFLTNS